MKEELKLKRNRYFTDKGNHTCALNFKTLEVCEYYRTYRFGTIETCVMADDSKDILYRRNSDGDTLIPGAWCPLSITKFPRKGTLNE